MNERGVFRGRTARSLLLRSGFRSAGPAASLSGDEVEQQVADEHRHRNAQGPGEHRSTKCRRHEMFIAQAHEYYFQSPFRGAIYISLLKELYHFSFVCFYKHSTATRF